MMIVYLTDFLFLVLCCFSGTFSRSSSAETGKSFTGT